MKPVITPLVVANAGWVLWWASWMAAAFWSRRTRARQGFDLISPRRWGAAFGAVLLFLPGRIGAHLFRGVAAAAMAPLWRAPDILRWGLAVLVFAGFAFCWWARLHIGALWSGNVTVKEGHHVVDTGPYGLIRHPIYGGILFSAAATGLLRASPASLTGVGLMIVGLAGVARIEERFLRAHLGDGPYDAYARRVPMLLPWPRP
jgi:protein-S-isoprenylcysteine O-methyltransferase Ste14